MLKRRPWLLFSSLMALTFLIACGNPKNPPPPEWMSTQNPSASSGKMKASAQAQPAARDSMREAPAPSSLDALRRGESAATPASSPLKDVFFDFDSAEIKADARATLKANAAWLKANPAARVQIEGHCDERGTAEYNLALGAKRAQAAKDYIITLGIASDRLSTVSYGEEIPACKETGEGCWQKNRRARFVVTAGRPAS